MSSLNQPPGTYPMEPITEEMIQLLDAPISSAPPNKQLYANSSLSGSAVETEMLSSKSRLFNTRLPNLAIVHEKPEHRIIIYLKTQGRTNREIAAQMGYTEAWISQITRQPWFQVRLLEALDERPDHIEEFLKAQLEPTILRLVHLRDNAESESVQLGATINLLDRFLGKPIQRTEAKLEVTKREERVTDIDAEIKLLEVEEAKIKTILREGRAAPIEDLTESSLVENAAGLSASLSP